MDDASAFADMLTLLSILSLLLRAGMFKLEDVSVAWI